MVVIRTMVIMTIMGTMMGMVIMDTVIVIVMIMSRITLIGAHFRGLAPKGCMWEFLFTGGGVLFVGVLITRDLLLGVYILGLLIFGDSHIGAQKTV